MLFVGSETIESNLVKLETSCTVILPLTVSVLCSFEQNIEPQRTVIIALTHRT